MEKKHQAYSLEVMIWNLENVFLAERNLERARTYMKIYFSGLNQQDSLYKKAYFRNLCLQYFEQTEKLKK